MDFSDLVSGVYKKQPGKFRRNLINNSLMMSAVIEEDDHSAISDISRLKSQTLSARFTDSEQ